MCFVLMIWRMAQAFTASLSLKIILGAPPFGAESCAVFCAGFVKLQRVGYKIGLCLKDSAAFTGGH